MLDRSNRQGLRDKLERVSEQLRDESAAREQQTAKYEAAREQIHGLEAANEALRDELARAKSAHERLERRTQAVSEESDARKEQLVTTRWGRNPRRANKPRTIRSSDVPSLAMWIGEHGE